jgi:two-component system, sensor histidine kinase and response regulator
MTNKPKILTVDDKVANLHALEKILSPLEVQIYQTTQGSEALALSLENDFCVAIVDLQMPEIDGYELVELLRGNQSTASLPVIFVSAVYSDEYHHRKAYDAGAVDFMAKPFIPEVLLSKVKVFIDLYQQRQKLQTLVAQLNITNQQLEVTNKDLERFAYAVSHDLRTPLRAMDGFAKILQNDFSDRVPTEALQYFQKIQDGAGKMHTLIEGLLQFSRLGLRPIRYQAISMTILARQVLDELLAQEPERKIEITIQAMPEVRADAFLMQQVLTNLLSNALKFTCRREAAEIQIGALEEVDPVIYYVRDNGVGFDMRYADKLFGVFQRLHRADDFDGIGIGLANVNRIITRHGGRIWAEGYVNQGATFYFTIPDQPELEKIGTDA